jgi:hypothetical protein
MRFREYGAGENRFDRLAPTPVLSPTRITLENNGKIRSQPDRENAFAGASRGADATDVEPSLGRKLLILLRRTAGSNVTRCKRD